jgi:hypothetical protein
LTKIVLRKTTSAIFLAIILVTGTITLINPTSMINVQATSDHDKDYDNDEEKDFDIQDRDDESRNNDGDYDEEEDDDDKDKFYEKGSKNYNENDYDNDEAKKSYDKEKSYDSKYSSHKDSYKTTKYSTFKKNNLKCNNINLNLNGLDVNASPEPLSSLLQLQAETTENPNSDPSTFDNGVERNAVGYQQDKNKNKDFSFTCINNNDNEFILPLTPIPPRPINNICTTWVEQTDTSPVNSDIYFARSNDNGLTFSIPQNISKNTGFSGSQQVICEGNNVYIVWQGNAPGPFDIYFARSNDNGLTFSDPDNISETALGSVIPQISLEGNNVYVVWVEQTNTPLNNEIFFVRSTDGGLTFSDPENISETAQRSGSPQISSEGNNVYVVWEDSENDTPLNRDIFFARSTDGGLTFSEYDNISEQNTGNSFSPQISSEGNNVYVVWEDDTDNIPGNTDIFFARSTNGGLTFSEPENISENPEFAFEPQISSEGNNVYVVWSGDTDNPDITAGIFFARSTDGGLTFSEPVNISEEDTGDAIDPQISTEGNNVYVVWEDDVDTPDIDEIFFARSTDGGLTFSESNNISESTGNSFSAQISSEGNNVYVVWSGDTDNPRNLAIFSARSTDDGLTFSEPDNISESTGFSQSPQISSTTTS